MAFRPAALALALLCCPLVQAQPASGDVARHLAIARELVENVKPEDNRYSLGSQFISFPGDRGSDKYAVRADCSGFLLAIFDRAKYPTRSQIAFLAPSTKRKRPASEDFVYSIEREKGFRRITRVADMQPGDLIAHAMLDAQDKLQVGTTGHVFLVNSLPARIAPWRPVVAGTRQFEVSVIDSNAEHVGADDSRLTDPLHKVHGLGKGTIRIYADDSGALVGWARTFSNSSRFFSYSPRFPSDSKVRKAAVGRPTAGN